MKLKQKVLSLALAVLAVLSVVTAAALLVRVQLGGPSGPAEQTGDWPQPMKDLLNRSWLGERWDIPTPGRTLGNTLFAPNPPIPNCEIRWDQSDIDGPGIFGLSSFHPGGCNVMMADGSVRFLKSTTNQKTVWALGSRDQGETISADSY